MKPVLSVLILLVLAAPAAAGSAVWTVSIGRGLDYNSTDYGNAPTMLTVPGPWNCILDFTRSTDGSSFTRWIRCFGAHGDSLTFAVTCSRMRPATSASLILEDFPTENPGGSPSTSVSLHCKLVD